MLLPRFFCIKAQTNYCALNAVMISSAMLGQGQTLNGHENTRQVTHFTVVTDICLTFKEVTNQYSVSIFQHDHQTYDLCTSHLIP